MKKTLTKFMALSSIALLMLASCKKNDPMIKTNGGTAGALTASATNLTLDKSRLTDTTKIINFTFTKPVYGFSAAVTNTLQIDSVGDNWKKPMSATLGTKALSQGYSTADFNALLLKLNLHAGVASQVQVRVQHSLGAGAAPIYSNIVNMTVTPFNLTSFLYVAGAYEGWTNPGPQEDSLVSVTGNGVYVGIINFTAGNNQFLVLPAKNWNHKYATTDAQNITSSTVTYDGPNNFYAPAAAGQYIVTFNTNNNTISFALANTYSVIGDGALGWNPGNDVAMKYLNDGTSTWTVTTSLVSSGTIKIRQNDDWTYSWGIPKPGSEGDGIAGDLNDTSNNNIPVPANGTYTVTFSIPLTTTADKPPVTASYTLK